MKLLKKYLLLDVTILGMLFVFVCVLLAAGGLTFRRWAWLLAMAVLGFGGIAGVVQLIWYLQSKAARAVLLVLFALTLAFVVFPFLLVSFAFGDMPEYVVERGGRQYVACEKCFLKTWVYYYDYRGFLVMGSHKRIEEYYGKQYFDPEDMLHNAEAVQEVIYYDDNGSRVMWE